MRILLVIGIILTHSVPTSAISRVIPTINYDPALDVVVRAPQSSYFLDFPAPRQVKLQSAIVSVALTPGSQIHEDSTFSIIYNDKAIQTRTAKDLRQRKEWIISLPTADLMQNKIRVQIKANMHISNDFCRDYNSGNLFFTVHPKESKLTLNYEMMPTKTVSDFFGNLQQIVYVVVPNNAELAEIMPAAWVYGIIKKNYPHMQVGLVKAAELAGKPAAPRVWVGTKGRLPAYFSKTTAGIELADANTLLISGATLGELEAAVQRLATVPLLMMDSAAGAKEGSSSSSAAGGKTPGITFGNQVAQEGLFQVTSDFVVYAGQFGTVPEKLGMNLEGAYTVSKDSNKPVRMDVFFNDKIVNSSVLDQTGRFTREINFPAGTELLSQNRIKVQFNFPDDPDQCKIVGKLQSAQIFPNSYLWGEGKKKISHMTWQNISPYLSQQGTVIIDEKLNGNILEILAKTINYLNRQLPEKAYAYPRVQGLSELAFIPPDQFVLVLAQAKNLPGFIVEQLPGLQAQGANSYNPSGSSTMPSEFKNSEKLAIGRVSEYKNNPLVVVATNQDGNLISLFLEYIGKPENAQKIRGNIVAYFQSGKIEDINLAKIEQSTSAMPIDIKNSAVDFWQKNQKAIIFTGVAVIVVILLISLYWFLRKRKKEREYYSEYEDEARGPEQTETTMQQYPQYYDDLDEELAHNPELIIAPRRGRPRKAAVLAAASQHEIIENEAPRQSIAVEAPRKRGRPKKQPVEATLNTNVWQPAEPIVIQVEKRKRGRPPKNSQPQIDK